jgi:hypothetical protein
MKLKFSHWFHLLDQRFITCGPRTPWGTRRLLMGPWLFKKLNNFSQHINKEYIRKKNQNLKLKILKRSVKMKEFEIRG